MQPAGLLIVAGHDSSGQAGTDADLQAAAAFGVPARLVTTAWTEQDSVAVHAVHPVDPDEWAAEFQRALRLAPAAIKVGLLPGASHIRRLAEQVADLTCPIIVDPVLRASSGSEFLDQSSQQALLEELLPTGVYLTPNIPEAAILTGRDPDSLAVDPHERIAAAREFLERGARGVVLKGGHAKEHLVQDLVLSPSAEPNWIEHLRIAGPGIRGSGCRHSTALAAGLGGGESLFAAATQASSYLRQLLVLTGFRVDS